MSSTFQCTLVTPEQQLLDQPVRYASIPAWDGQIGLMHNRAPLLVQLGDGPMRLELADGSTRTFFVAGGFAQMKDDRLSVLTSEAIESDEIDSQAATAALNEAQARRAFNDDEIRRRDRQLNRARAMLRLSHRR